VSRFFLILAFVVIALLLSTVDLSTTAADPPKPPQASTRTKIVMLGTGTPITDPDRSGPAVAIIVDEQPYLVDFGPGVVRRAAAAHRAGAMGPVSKLTRAFVTHLHSDHTVGYSDLIFTTWVMDRAEPLEVYGPKGLKSMTAHVVAAYKEDIDMRVKGLELADPRGYQVNVHEIKPGLIYQDKNIQVTAFPVNHGSWKYAYGFRFQTPDRTIVVSGDCAPTQAIIEQCNGCDVLIHEVYSEAGFKTRPPKWQKYHSNFHTSTRELGELATRARPGLLILYHQLFWGMSEESLMKEMQQYYKGRVASAHDLEVF
jgi:ribonuclease BN (tRNA processing enzyme)